MHARTAACFLVGGRLGPPGLSLSAVAEMKGKDGIWNGAFRETHMQVALDRPAGS
jgi:hypothetical protein